MQHAAGEVASGTRKTTLPRPALWRQHNAGAEFTILRDGLAIREPLVSDKKWQSIAALVAWHRELVNVTDAYDGDEIAAIHRSLTFLRAIDERTGYRTRQILAAPVVSDGGDRLGVVELINRIDNRRFPRECEDGMTALCAILAEVWDRLPSIERDEPAPAPQAGPRPPDRAGRGR